MGTPKKNKKRENFIEKLKTINQGLRYNPRYNYQTVSYWIRRRLERLLLMYFGATKLDHMVLAKWGNGIGIW